MGLHDRDYMRQPTRSPWALVQGMNALHVIIWANVIVFVAQSFFGLLGERVSADDFRPYGGVSVDGLAAGKVWTAFTYMFVHGSLLHIGGNMLMVYFAGKRVLAVLGTRHFLNIYFLSGLIGAAVELLIQGYASPEHHIGLVGASACAFGLFLALAVLFPQEEVTAMIYLIIPVKVRLWTMAKVLLALSLGLGLFGLLFPPAPGASTIASFAHLGGAFTGWYYLRLIGFGGMPMTYERLRRERAGSPFGRRAEMVRARHKRLSVNLEIDPAAPRPRNGAGDVISDEVDPILEKISEHGMGSLTAEERRVLERVSREIGKGPPRRG